MKVCLIRALDLLKTSNSNRKCARCWLSTGWRQMLKHDANRIPLQCGWRNFIIMSPNLPYKMLFRGIPPTLLLQWAFHGRGGYTPPDAFAMVWRHVASICDRSFDVISILGKIVFRPNSYIGIKMIFFQNRSFKIDSGQTAPHKMTAMTIGSY